jgi:SpoVK/Ycf46/Vps4 family AAA+-type ATPase
MRQRRKEAMQADIPTLRIPDWFLQDNVKLYLDVDECPPNSRAALNLGLTTCVDKETGDTLFALPYYRSTTAAKLRLAMLIPGRGLEPKWPEILEKKPVSGGKDAPVQQDEPIVAVAKLNHLRWPMLQAETGVLAAFSMARHNSRSKSRGASRVDLMLHCTDDHSHEQLDGFVEDLATVTGADLVRLDANDFADLSTEYLGTGTDTLDAFANLAYDIFHGYASAPRSFSQQRPMDAEDEAFDQEEAEEEEEEEEPERPPRKIEIMTLDQLKRTLFDRRHEFAKGLFKVTRKDVIAGAAPSYPYSGSREGSGYNESRLLPLFEKIIDAPGEKRSSKPSEWYSVGRRFNASKAGGDQKELNAQPSPPDQRSWPLYELHPETFLPAAATLLADFVGLSKDEAALGFRREFHSQSSIANTEALQSTARTIIHVRDLREIGNSQVGDFMMRVLLKAVQRRRRAGHEVVIVGTSCSRTIVGPTPVLDHFRSISVPAVFQMSKQDAIHFKSPQEEDVGANPPYGRILEINMRHMQRMLKDLRPEHKDVDLSSQSAQKYLSLGGDMFSRTVLPFDMVQRIVLTAIGIFERHAVSKTMNASHIWLAASVERQSKLMGRAWSNYLGRKTASPDNVKEAPDGANSSQPKQSKVDSIKQDLNQHENRLLPGVVDAGNIRTGFDQVHAPIETIDALQTLTSLSLLRPDAFTYGVLATDRLPGLMLYGPPGTGKTLLAKAVAKESGATMLEISGAQVYEKYVGEGAKMVRAVFSLAKKLSPCIVFIDEADSIFGSRGGAGSRNTHREILNQFLREWDGMGTHNVFLMVATNRPFDMDDAVLRRLPRRLLVDLPVAQDREAILKIHLNGEDLDDSVNIPQLAKDTALYSGSDLKNLCVAAALACVREENDLAHSKRGDKDFKLPAKRVLADRHFEKATKEISASINEDMNSLTAIRKFDEQYGDRRGRRKKANYGFGLGDEQADEGAARVRRPPAP